VAGAVSVMTASAGASGKGHGCDGFEHRCKCRCQRSKVLGTGADTGSSSSSSGPRHHLNRDPNLSMSRNVKWRAGGQAPFEWVNGGLWQNCGTGDNKADSDVTFYLCLLSNDHVDVRQCV
jgi:hypothetical protein